MRIADELHGEDALASEQEEIDEGMLSLNEIPRNDEGERDVDDIEESNGKERYLITLGFGCWPEN